METKNEKGRERKCASGLCEKPFAPLRSNQFYCSKSCKNKWNNHLALLERQKTLPIDRQVRKNYKILGEYYRVKKFEVTKQELENKGFKQDKMNGFVYAQDGKTPIFQYYLFGIMITSINNFKIIKL